MTDIYEKEIERLTENPEQIIGSWLVSGPLFRFCTPTGHFMLRPDGKACGCLLPVRMFSCIYAWTDELTEAIRADERIPREYYIRPEHLLRPEHLPVFAEWQHRLDRELGRTPPEMEE